MKAELIKAAKMASIMHVADRAYSIQSTWWLHRLATNVPFIACVINSLSVVFYDLDLSKFLLTFIYLSLVGLFCECCRMLLLWLLYSELSDKFVGCISRGSRKCKSNFLCQPLKNSLATVSSCPKAIDFSPTGRVSMYEKWSCLVLY